MSKLITIVNWTAVAFLIYFILTSLLNTTKGDDPASAGNIWPTVALVALVLLVLLNLLPYKWAKYVALALVALPVALLLVDIFYIEARKLFRYPSSQRDESPYFTDPQRQAIAKAIANESISDLSELLQKPVPLLNDYQNRDSITLLDYAARRYNSHRMDWERSRRILELLIQAGATINSTHPQRLATHARIIGTCPARALRLFLDYGADPQAKGPYQMSLLFEAILSSEEAFEKVEMLLDQGVSPNGTDTFDVESEHYSPLLFAAHIDRWAICLLLIRRGADVHFKAPNGMTLTDYIKKQEDQISSGQTTPSPEFKALIEQLSQQK